MASSVQVFTGLKAVLDPLFGGEVYPNVLPPKAVSPSATYQLISSPAGDVTHSGPNSFVHEERWQVTVWGSNYDTVVAKADQVRTALHGMSGTWGPVTVQQSRVATEIDGWDDTTLWSRRIFDLLITYV